MRLRIPAFARRLVPSWQARHWQRVWRSADSPYWLVDEPRPAIIAAAREAWFPRVGTLLEIGCGTGGNAAWLASQGWTVLATDVARSAVARARARHGAVQGLTFSVLDACAADRLNRTFPAILDSGCLHVVPAELRPRYRDNVVAWSAPGTRYLLRMGDDVFSPDEAETIARSLFGERFAFESVALAPRTSRVDETKRSIVFRLIRR